MPSKGEVDLTVDDDEERDDIFGPAPALSQRAHTSTPCVKTKRMASLVHVKSCEHNNETSKVVTCV